VSPPPAVPAGGKDAPRPTGAVEIDWNDPAEKIASMVTRAEIGAFTHRVGVRVWILQALPLSASGAPCEPGEVAEIHLGTGFTVGTGSGLLLVRRARAEGARELAGDEFAVENGLAPGYFFGCDRA
jgi:methionyl-tRNA formyltransferase